MTPSEPERIKVTESDLAQAGNVSDAPKTRPVVPWWGILAGTFLTLCLPLLCLYALAIRVGIRSRESGIRAAWNQLLCTLLVISGFASSIAWSYLWFVRFDAPVSISGGSAVRSSDHLESLDNLSAFAQPGMRTMNSVELAAWSKPLVVIVSHGENLEMASLGAGMLLLADAQGYLFGTNRHVADTQGWLDFRRQRDRVLVFPKDGDPAGAAIVGRHRMLDLALLWVPRKSGVAAYRQPVTPFRSIAVGSPMFVIGHPQRLFFTLSNGLVSRLSGSDILQISAPVSPGNSGGPVYDAFGNLLGVVTSKMDRENNPNAENLNFATRADAFLTEAGWDLTGPGKDALHRFAAPTN